jgi:PAS domain S-box-containing protein
MTDQHHTEEPLQESEGRYRSIIEDQTELICRFRPDYTLTFINAAYCRFFKRKKEELIGFNFINLIPDGDQKAVRDHIASLSKERPVSTHEHQVLLPDGEIGYQQWTNRAILGESGDIEEFQAVGRDITDRRRMEEVLRRTNDDLERLVANRTARLLRRNKQLLKEIEERKKTEEALRASEEKHRSVVDHIGIGVSLISPDMKIVTLNNQMKRWFPLIDVSKKPLCYEAFNDLPRETVCSYCPTIKTLQDGQVHESITETPAGNEIRHYRIISSPIKDRNGRVLSAIEMVDDITDWMKVQERLRESERRLSEIIEFLPDATFAVDRDGRVMAWNRAIEEMTGVKAGNITGKGNYEYALPFYGTRRPILIDMAFSSNEEVKKKYSIIRKENDVILAETEVVMNGVTRVLWAKARCLYDSKGNIVGALQSIRDITDRRQAEEAIKKRESELEMKSRNLEELNTALRVLLRRREEDKREFEERVLANIKQLVMPYIEKIRMGQMDEKDMSYVTILESNLKNIVSPFSQRLSSKYLNLTPKEIQIANLIRDGRTTKEIAELLNASPGTIDFHRNNIRRKLNMRNKKANLRTYLLTVS